MSLERRSDGKLWHYTSVGSYPIVYVCADGGELCPTCANGGNNSEASESPDTDQQWRLVAAFVHWEGQPIVCDHCGTEIESAYGDPDSSSE